MKVTLDGGAVIDIGETAAAPTISLIDYSRRETDDFGVTTVVPRAFSRQMSVKVKVDTEDVDAVQRQLAALRATPAHWSADASFDSLSFRGFFKDFSIDLALPPVSYCTLTIEGLAADEVFADPGTDPAPDGRTSTLRLLQPTDINDAVLTQSTVPESDYPQWAAGATYALGARVILSATHRIYESSAGGNVGNSPSGTSGLWIDIGPTNRWAMFDQALGSLTEANGSIAVILHPGSPVDALALLDVTGSTVRVQAPGYDRTKAPAASPGMVTFLDMPTSSAPITVTISGAGTVSVGTLLLGSIVGLGITGENPTAGITDFSRKEVDDFGEVTLVERAWAKRMSVRALIDTTAIDLLASRIAQVRAVPSLWIGDDSLESVTVYGFFKDFSIEVGDSVSVLSLSIEGLSKAAKIAPIVDAGDVAYEDGTPFEVLKPATPNATAGAPDDSPVGGTTAAKVIDALLALGSVTEPDQIVAGAQALITRTQNHALALYDAQLLAQERKERFERLTHLDGIEIGVRVVQETNARIEGDTAIVERVDLIEATNATETAALLARIELEETVRASADAAETLSRLTQVSALEIEVDGHVTALEASIVEEQTTRADAISAEAVSRNAQVAILTAADVDINAALVAETSARVTADGAETSARELAISALETTFDSQITLVQASIEGEATTRATADTAETSARELALSLVQIQIDNEILDRQAAILSEASTRADAIAAETSQREIAMSALQDSVDGQILTVQASIEDEATTRATADAAETAARELAISTFEDVVDGQIADVTAAISSEASTRATAIAAETTAREQAISDIQTEIDGEITTVMAAIASEASTRATADEAEATLREALAASVASDISDVNAAILSEASVRATGDEAEATAREALAATLLGDIADVSAAVESEATARVAEDGALASLLTTVQTTVDGNTASVLMLLEAIDGINAKWGVRLDVDGYITGVVLNNDGDEGSFDVLADSFRVVSPGGGDRYEYSDGTQRIVAGSVMTVYGVAFGSAEQFIEWTGPIQASLDDCTEANAIKYVRVDGSAYFGGGLSSGTLKNEGTSSTIDPAAFIIVGPFASNGEPINVNMSATFTHSYICDTGTGGISGTGGGTLTLEWSSDGSSWNFLTSIGVNETERLVVVDGDPTVDDFVSWSMAAAGTYTWTPGALSGVHIRLRWTSFSEPTLLGTTIVNTEKSQRTSVIAVEQP